ncbi:hypothetical protein TGMAS_414860 [Toxoplasma gondii MAS]|uniref:Uncharacterized protein n=1 Tax=Toxoplasma gondii MAS TaxID=943118 RepID=A0A086QI05_TOXGO|nr:hypothetical protein TGMAS_414860 [Toxoplasma gondii MAS]
MLHLALVQICLEGLAHRPRKTIQLFLSPFRTTMLRDLRECDYAFLTRAGVHLVCLTKGISRNPFSAYQICPSPFQDWIGHSAFRHLLISTENQNIFRTKLSAAEMWRKITERREEFLPFCMETEAAFVHRSVIHACACFLRRSNKQLYQFADRPPTLVFRPDQRD